MLKKVIPFLLISITVFGQSNNIENTGNNSIKIGWKKFEQTNFSISYPPTWVVDKSEAMGTRFVIFSPIESPTDKFKENVNLIIQDLTGQKIDLNKYTEISEGQVKSMVTNSKLIESVRMKDEKGEYHKIIYSGDQGVFHLQFEQYYFVKKEKAYVLTLTCEKSKFSDYKLMGEKILKSFLLKN